MEETMQNDEATEMPALDETAGDRPDDVNVERRAFRIDVQVGGAIQNREFVLVEKFTLEVRAFMRQMIRKTSEYYASLDLDSSLVTIQDLTDFVCSRPAILRKAMTIGWIGNHGGIDWARDVDPGQVEDAIGYFFVGYNNSISTKSD